MKEIIFLCVFCVIIVVGIAILDTESNETADARTTIIQSEETFQLNCGELQKGKEITWDWEIENNLLNPPLILNFWIEDTDGNKYAEIQSSRDRGSFTVPFTDSWTLKWENPYPSPEEIEGHRIELTYNIEIVNQPPTASIQADKTSGPAPLTVSFTGAGVDYDGIIKSYHWDFGDGNTSNAKHPTHTFPNSGTYTVILTVTDDEGATGKDTTKITVT